MQPKDYSNYGIAQELLRLRTHAPEIMAEAARRLQAIDTTPPAAPAATEGPSGVLQVQEADCVHHVHPQYGSGIFFTEDAILAAPTTAAAVGAIPEPLQPRVQPWLMKCFGSMIAGDKEERNHRFLEEALELVQACGCTASEAHQLVDYVFGRPIGEKDQEVGGVMITLAALCLANGLDMHDAGERELARIWTMVEKIRAKQAAKPKHSPLPVAVGTSVQPVPENLIDKIATAARHAYFGPGRHGDVAFDKLTENSKDTWRRVAHAVLKKVTP